MGKSNAKFAIDNLFRNLTQKCKDKTNKTWFKKFDRYEGDRELFGEDIYKEGYQAGQAVKLLNKDKPLIRGNFRFVNTARSKEIAFNGSADEPHEGLGSVQPSNSLGKTPPPLAVKTSGNGIPKAVSKNKTNSAKTRVDMLFEMQLKLYHEGKRRDMPIRDKFHTGSGPC